MGWGSLAGWQELAFGARAVRPTLGTSLIRWALVAVLGAYVAAGQARDNPRFVAGALSFVVAANALSEALVRAGGRREKLRSAWWFALPTDILAIAVAATVDNNDLSPIPLLSVATILAASIMFKTRYVIALTALAAAMAVLAHLPLDVEQGDFTFWGQAFEAAVILAVGGYAAIVARNEEELRRRLMTSEERERQQSRELRQALEAARLSEGRFEAVMEHAPAIVALFDGEGAPTFASRYLESAFAVPGTSLGDAELWRDRIPADELPEVGRTIRAAVAGSVRRYEFTIVDRQGEPRRMSGVFFPREDGAGAIVHDVTAERLLALQLSRARQIETLGTLAGGIAHDFNNLLTTILGNLYLVKNEIAPDSQAMSMLTDAETAGQRGADLVRQLLEYSRPGYSELEPVRIQRLVDETSRLARRGLTPRIRMLVGDFDPAAIVTGNFNALQQVLLNLIVNARDAMPDGGQLIISVDEVTLDDEAAARRTGGAPGRYHALSVADTGRGIPPAMLGRVFDPFFTTKQMGKGTGLGLSTALNIARAHGGWIDVESQVGRGTTFRVFLPVARVLVGAARS